MLAKRPCVARPVRRAPQRCARGGARGRARAREGQRSRATKVTPPPRGRHSSRPAVSPRLSTSSAGMAGRKSTASHRVSLPCEVRHGAGRTAEDAWLRGPSARTEVPHPGPGHELADGGGALRELIGCSLRQNVLDRDRVRTEQLSPHQQAAVCLPSLTASLEALDVARRSEKLTTSTSSMLRPRRQAQQPSCPLAR